MSGSQKLPVMPFQSTPVISGGRAWAGRTLASLKPCFNPRSSFLAGEPYRYDSAGRYVLGFNPRPSFLAGEPEVARVWGSDAIVSIHARHFWRTKQLS